MDYGYEMDTEQEYFNWLCDLIHIDQIERTYWLLAKDLYRKPFIALIDHDDNRCSDGIELREEFLRDYERDGYLDMGRECSMLEMMIALARRIDFATSDPNDIYNTDTTSYWFWEMIDNLGLIEFDDDSYVELDGQTYVDWILDGFVNRQYSENGEGGLFPLDGDCEDQREVEIWYQMNAYLEKHNRF